MPAQDPCVIPLLANPFSPVEIAVGGPGVSTDNAVARWDGTGGNLLQNSGVIIDDSDNVTVPGVLSISLGTLDLPGVTFIGDTDTGLFRHAADQLGLTMGSSPLVLGDAAITLAAA